jgi:hypothetical protein
MKKIFAIFIISLLLLLPASAVLAGSNPSAGVDPLCTQGGGGSTALCNPLQSPDLPDLLMKMLAVFASFFGFTTIIMVVFAGFRMMISMGNPQALMVAKSALVWSLAGFVLAMFSFALVMAIGNYLGLQEIDRSAYETNADVVNPLNSSSMYDLIIKILTGFMGIAAVLALLMIIVSGIRYATSAGNEQQAATAKQSLQWAIIGLVVIILGYVIVQATATFFGGN